MSRIIDPMARARTFAARRGGLTDGARLNRRIARVERALSPSRVGQSDIAENWEMSEVVEELPEPDDTMIGRRVHLFGDNLGQSGTENIVVEAPDGSAVWKVLAGQDAQLGLRWIRRFGVPGSGTTGLTQPSGLAFLPDSETLLIVDNGNNRIARYSLAGSYVGTTGSSGSGVNQMSAPIGVAVDANAARVYVTDAGNDRVLVYTTAMAWVQSFSSVGATNGLLQTPEGIGVDSAGNVYVADNGNNRIQKFAAGTYAYVAQVALAGVNAIAVDDDDRIIAVGSGDQIKIYDSSLALLHTYSSLGSADGLLNNPRGVAVDSEGNIYVVEQTNDRFQVFSSEGEHIGTFASSGSRNGQFLDPFGIAISPVNGEVVISDDDLDRLNVWERADAQIMLRALGDVDMTTPSYGSAVVWDGAQFVDGKPRVVTTLDPEMTTYAWDFIGGLAGEGWAYAGNGAASNLAADYGDVQATSGGANGNNGRIFTTAEFDLRGVNGFSFVVEPNYAGGATTTADMQFGFTDVPATPTLGLWIECLAANTTWRLRYYNGTSLINVDTGLSCGPTTGKMLFVARQTPNVSDYGSGVWEVELSEYLGSGDLYTHTFDMLTGDSVQGQFFARARCVSGATNRGIVVDRVVAEYNGGLRS